MLGSSDLIAFVPTRDPGKARKFYVAGQSGEGILFGSYSLTRCEPRWLPVALRLRWHVSRVSCYARRCLRGRPHPPSHWLRNCSDARMVRDLSPRAGARRASLGLPVFKCSHGTAPTHQRRGAVMDLVWEARGVLVDGVSRSKRLARAVVVCARGSMRV